MLRRQLSLLICAFALNAAAPLAFSQGLYNEGTQYFRLKQTVPVASGAKIEVVEVFSYACIHCAHLEPAMQAWRAKMPANALFVGLPAIFQDSWVTFARAYYAAESLGILEKSHAKLFHTMWEEKKQFASLPDLAKWYSQFGVTEKQFTDAFTAAGMEAKLKAVMERVPRYEVEGTPTLIVDGKFRLDVTSAGGMDKVGPLLNFLIAKAASERGKS